MKLIATRVRRSSIRVEVGLKQHLRILHVARPSAQESTEKAAAVEESGKSKKVDSSDVGLKTRGRVTRTTKETRHLLPQRGRVGLRAEFLSRDGRRGCALQRGAFGVVVVKSHARSPNS